MDAVKKAVNDAYEVCLGTCFATLVDNLASKEVGAESLYRNCCELCRKALLIASKETDMDNCNFSYPTADQATDAGTNLHDMASGAAPWDADCFAHCAWTLQGFALSQKAAQPCPCPQPCPEPTPEQKSKLATALAPVKSYVKGGRKGAFDWLAIIKTVLAVIQQILNTLNPPTTPTPGAKSVSNR